MPKQEEVILVDEQDQMLGLMEKMQAHLEGRLHRAFSVLIFNSKGEMLLHKRAEDKYHCGGLWTNACCSHPRENEHVIEAAIRRTVEEIGVQVKPEIIGSFVYKASFSNGLTEYEYDHILVAESDEEMHLNPEEVSEVAYVSPLQLMEWISTSEEEFTPWFRLLLQEEVVQNFFNQHQVWQQFSYPQSSL